MEIFSIKPTTIIAGVTSFRWVLYFVSAKIIIVGIFLKLLPHMPTAIVIVEVFIVFPVDSKIIVDLIIRYDLNYG